MLLIRREACRPFSSAKPLSLGSCLWRALLKHFQLKTLPGKLREALV
jgi:hypothetical protein